MKDELMEVWLPIVCAAKETGNYLKAFPVNASVIRELHARLERAEQTIERFEKLALESKSKSSIFQWCQCGNVGLEFLLGVCKQCYDKVRNG